MFPALATLTKVPTARKDVEILSKKAHGKARIQTVETTPKGLVVRSKKKVKSKK